MSNAEPAVPRSRGFSGATKFSDFKKSAASDNSQEAKANKDTKPASKARGLSRSEDYRDALEAHNAYKEEKECRVKALSVDDDDDDDEDEDEGEDGKERPRLKDKITQLAREIRNMTHEVKGLYDCRVKHGHGEV